MLYIGIGPLFPVARKGRTPFFLVSLRLLNRSADEVAPLGPRTVVVLHVGEPEQVLQHEPGVARSLADSTVSDDRLGRRYAFRAIERDEPLTAFERAIVVS